MVYMVRMRNRLLADSDLSPCLVHGSYLLTPLGALGRLRRGALTSVMSRWYVRLCANLVAITRQLRNMLRLERISPRWEVACRSICRLRMLMAHISFLRDY